MMMCRRTGRRTKCLEEEALCKIDAYQESDLKRPSPFNDINGGKVQGRKLRGQTQKTADAAKKKKDICNALLKANTQFYVITTNSCMMRKYNGHSNNFQKIDGSNVERNHLNSILFRDKMSKNMQLSQQNYAVGKCNKIPFHLRKQYKASETTITLLRQGKERGRQSLILYALYRRRPSLQKDTRPSVPTS